MNFDLLGKDLQWVKERLIFLTKEQNGTVLRGIVIPPIQYLFGLNTFGSVSVKTPAAWIQVYDIRVFMRHARFEAQTISNMLQSRPEDHVFVHPIARRLLDQKELFAAAVADREAISRLCVELVQDSFEHHVRVPVMAPGFDSQIWGFSSGTLEAKRLSQTEE